MDQYPEELPPLPPLFDYPLSAPPIEINGTLVYGARDCAAFFLYCACQGRPKAIELTLRLIKELNLNIDATQLLNRCKQSDRAAILQAIALMSLALEYRFEREIAEYN